MTITRIQQWCIAVWILEGQFAVLVKILPHITLSTTEGELPFILTRKQFSIHLSFAMTVNKTQGQLLDSVGIDSREPAFTHGQLYVTPSRGTEMQLLKVLLPEEHSRTTQNIVYPEVLIRCIVQLFFFIYLTLLPIACNLFYNLISSIRKSRCMYAANNSSGSVRVWFVEYIG